MNPQSAMSRISTSQFEKVFMKIQGNEEIYEKSESELIVNFTGNPSTDDGQFFNLLLIESINSEDYSNSLESLRDFLLAISYVGTSKTDAPDQYFSEARCLWGSKSITTDKIVQGILDIWKRKNGVIALRVFPNRAKVEAKLRQVVMHESLGFETLDDDYHFLLTPLRKRGDTSELGIYLLYKAFEEFLRQKPAPQFPPEQYVQNINLQSANHVFAPITEMRLPPTERNTLDNEILITEFENNEEYYEDREWTAFREYETLEPCSSGKSNPEFFNYLLIDPRKYDETGATLSNLWQSFLSTIFFVGTGKDDQPLKHFQRAADTLRQGDNIAGTAGKSQRIVEIWKSVKQGVIILRLFAKKFEAEALTREALMIDGIGLGNLCQKNCDTHNGPSAQWRSEEKLQLGIYLLYKAFKEFLGRGEDQETAFLDDSHLNGEQMSN